MPDWHPRAHILLAFDVGKKKTGIAVGNKITCGARPLAVVRGGTIDAQLDGLRCHIEEWRPGRCIVGLPRHMDGTTHRMTELCRKFGRRLEERYPTPVDYVDERMSSAVAATIKAIDKDAAAAAIILQAWLDKHAAEGDEGRQDRRNQESSNNSPG